MKKIFILCTFVFATAISAQTINNGLVAYYPFCGNSNDISGNNYHLTPAGNPQLSTDRFNAVAQSYSFNGTSDMFTNSNYGPLNSKSRSVTFWAKTAQASDYDGQTVLYYGNDQNGFGSRYEVGLNGQCNGPYNDIGYGQVAVSYPSDDNQWHHYAIVYDSTIAMDLTAVSFYVDAVLTSSLCYNYGNTQPLSTSTGSGITVGNIHSPYTRWFNGSLDEIRLYNRALTPSEVTAIMNYSCACGSTATISAITGSVMLCYGSHGIYSVTPVAGATSYSWNLPIPLQGASTSNTILVTTNNNTIMLGSFTMQVTANTGCGTVSSSKVVNTAICEGISQFNKPEFNIYPNPVKDIVVVEADRSLPYTVFNLIGLEVASDKLNSGKNQISLETLPGGVYFLKIGEGENSVTKKLVKQ